MSNKNHDLEFKIGKITVKPSHNQLIFDSEVVLIEPLAMAMLVKLAENHGEVIYRQQLMEELWHAKVVTDNALHRIVTLLRKGLNDDPKKPKFIETVPKKGYKLIHPIEWINKVEHEKRKELSSIFLSLVSLVCFSFIVGMFFWSHNKVTQYQLVDEQQITSLIGVEHSAVFLPKLKDLPQSYIFVYEDREQSHNKIALKTIDESGVFDLISEPVTFRQLSVSPSGKKIAFVKSDNSKCQLYIAELSIEDKRIFNQRKVTECQLMANLTPQWLNENDLYYLLMDRVNFQNEIMHFELKTNRVSKLFNERPAGADDYSFSVEPNTSRIAYIRHFYENANIKKDMFELKVFNIQTKTDRFIIKSSSEAIYEVDWFLGKDNSLIIDYQTGKKVFETNGQSFNILSSGLDNVYRIDSNQQSQVLYTKLDYKIQTVEYDLNENSISNSKVIAPSTANEYRGTYSHDGQSIAYFSNKEHSNYRLWLTKGGKEQPLELGVDIVRHVLDWSPNDNELLLLKTQKHQLISYHLGQNKITYLTEPDEKIRRGIWSKNSDVIFYVQETNQQYNIYQKNLVTHQITQLTEDGANYLQESLDGKSLYFTAFDKKGLWRLDLQSGQKELFIENFSAKNYSNWQCSDLGVYYTQSDDAKTGVFFKRFDNQQQVTLLLNVDVKYFDVRSDQSQILVSLVEKYEGDLFIGQLIQKE